MGILEEEEEEELEEEEEDGDTVDTVAILLLDTVLNAMSIDDMDEAMVILRIGNPFRRDFTYSSLIIPWGVCRGTLRSRTINKYQFFIINCL